MIVITLTSDSSGVGVAGMRAGMLIAVGDISDTRTRVAGWHWVG